MEIRANNLQELRDGVINAITGGYIINKLEKESDIILNELLEINRLGLITTESQPRTRKRYSDSFFMQRAYLIGYFPHELMSLFVNKLTEINPNIIVAETILAPHGDGFNLWNFQKEA